MTLARIYPFFRKDRKMKMDKIKEEIANIRRTQNFFLTIFVGVGAYFFTNVKSNPTIRTALALSALIVLVIILLILNDTMKEKLNKLEKTGKDE